MRSTKYFRIRVVLFFAAVFIIPLPFPPIVRWVLFGCLVAVFIGVAIRHTRVDKSRLRVQAWRRIRKEQRARLLLDWDVIPKQWTEMHGHAHPFESDFDITGEKSLHRLLDASISTEGSRLLASWLLETNPDAHVILERQKLVQELLTQNRFRERFWISYVLVSKEQLDENGFTAWLREGRLPGQTRWVLPVSGVLAALNLILYSLALSGKIGAIWFFSAALYGVLYFMNKSIRETFLDAVVKLEGELAKMQTVFLFLEQWPDRRNAALRTLCAPFHTHTSSPSRAIGTLKRLAFTAGLSMNPVLMFLLNAFVPWDFFFAWRLYNHQQKLASVVPGWLEALHRLEALHSLANFAYLHPDYAFPVLKPASTTEGNAFSAIALGHPLLPAESKVCNDFSIAKAGELHIITGSNMAGKSTFLRTVGSNLVLAYAGAPVNAAKCETQWWNLYACIRINDSLSDGFSYFYAEVKRLKLILDTLQQLKERPTLFFIDEIFKGTNNIERYQGSAAYIRETARLGGTGLVSTHDIELTKLSTEIKAVINEHFREDVVEGTMLFDYTLRTGACPTTNALTIMRLEGLPVPE